MTDQPQHLKALGKANDVRLPRAELRTQVHALPLHEGRAKVAELLDRRHPLIQSMRVADLLGCKWIRRNSHWAVNAAMTAAGVSEYALVRDLTDRQIIALEDVLERQAETTVAWRRSAA